MTGTMRSSEGLEPRRKKILLRAWRRGIKEMDLILGKYADQEIGRMPEDQLSLFENLLEHSDLDLYSYIIGERSVPSELDTPLFRSIVQFARPGRFATPS